MSTEQGKNPRTLTGTVVSDKMMNTVVVAVERFVKHPKYQKFIKQTKRYHAHNEGDVAKTGDKVTIVESKPISKKKRFTVVQD